MTKEMQCTCKSDFQDERYGKNVRLFNEMKSGTKSLGWRCTVCHKEIK